MIGYSGNASPKTLLCLGLESMRTCITDISATLRYKPCAFRAVILATWRVHVLCEPVHRGQHSPFAPPSTQLAMLTLTHSPLPDLLQAQLPELMAETRELHEERHVSTLTGMGVTRTHVGMSTSATSVSVDTQPRVVQNASIDNLFVPLPDGVESPVNIDLLEFFLSHHPDRHLVAYVIDGFQHGFDIGFRGPISVTRPRNLRSARTFPDPVSTAIFKELSRGHTSGPFLIPPMSPFHCSPLGAVPKKDGTFRIILDLSSPHGMSINVGISKDSFSVRYSSFDDAVHLVRSSGTSAFMAKLDIRHAFRLCPVRPDQWNLLGFCWNGLFFCDTRLPFGSRSSPYIFNTFADLLLWILMVVGGIFG